jgi:hypothetical protein
MSTTALPRKPSTAELPKADEAEVVAHPQQVHAVRGGARDIDIVDEIMLPERSSTVTVLTPHWRCWALPTTRAKSCQGLTASKAGARPW